MKSSDGLLSQWTGFFVEQVNDKEEKSRDFFFSKSTLY